MHASLEQQGGHHDAEEDDVDAVAQPDDGAVGADGEVGLGLVPDHGDGGEADAPDPGGGDEGGRPRLGRAPRLALVVLHTGGRQVPVQRHARHVQQRHDQEEDLKATDVQANIEFFQVTISND